MLTKTHTILKFEFLCKNSILTNSFFQTYLNFNAKIGRYSGIFNSKRYQEIEFSCQKNLDFDPKIELTKETLLNFLGKIRILFVFQMENILSNWD